MGESPAAARADSIGKRPSLVAGRRVSRWAGLGFPFLRRVSLALVFYALAACGVDTPRRELAGPKVHRDTSGLGQVLRLDSVDGWSVCWAGVPLSDPQGIGPTDVVVAVWAVPDSPRSAGEDSVVVSLPKVLSDSLLPDSVRRAGSRDSARWWVRAPRCDPPWASTSWYHEAACGLVGPGMILVTSTR